jgi:hypothetical protein
MLCDKSRQKRVIPALLREEVWISSRREDLELDIIGKGACASFPLYKIIWWVRESFPFSIVDVKNLTPTMIKKICLR